jgi:LysR family transcriptional regulator for metE and metH
VVSGEDAVRVAAYVIRQPLSEDVLVTYPVSRDRLDIYTYFLTPAGGTVRKQKVVESTDIMLQMVACGRGVAALPRWLVEEFSAKYPVRTVKLGPNGVQKQIFLGVRRTDLEVDYLHAFIELARNYRDHP